MRDVVGSFVSVSTDAAAVWIRFSERETGPAPLVPASGNTNSSAPALQQPDQGEGESRRLHRGPQLSPSPPRPQSHSDFLL